MSYLLNIFNTGAVRPTPNKVIRAISEQVDGKASAFNIVELGAGKGEITSVILDKIADRRTEYFAFEFDEKQADELRQQFPGIKTLREDAFDFKKYLPEGFKADYFICALPLSFYPKEKTITLIRDAKQVLNKDGKLIILYTAFWLTPFLKKQFRGAQVTSFATLPPYFVLSYPK